MPACLQVHVSYAGHSHMLFNTTDIQGSARIKQLAQREAAFSNHNQGAAQAVAPAGSEAVEKAGGAGASGGALSDEGTGRTADEDAYRRAARRAFHSKVARRAAMVTLLALLMFAILRELVGRW